MSLESPNIHRPDGRFAGRSTIQLAFEPSDNLQEAIRQFVKPEERDKYRVHLRSDPVMQLRYTGGDASGIKYLQIPDQPGVPSDDERLYAYERQIETIHSQNIPVAARHPRYVPFDNGNMGIEVALLPSEQVKRRMGRTILRYVGIDEVVYARTVIPHNRLDSHDAITEAREAMAEQLGADEPWDIYQEHLQPSPSVNRMFVTDTYVTGRPQRPF